MRNFRTSHDKPKFIDRIAVAFLSGVTSFITGLVIWFLFAAMFDFEGPYIFSSFKLVFIFTGAMAALGFFLLDDLITTALGHLWHGIVDHLRH